MRTYWNDEEDAVLQGLPWIAQIIYLRCLRPHMDYATGIVGQGRRISWQMIRETLYVEPHQGLEDAGKPSLGKVRRAMEWLIKVGLVVDRGTKNRGEAIVFFLPMADRDESAQKKPGKNPARTRQGQPDIPISDESTKESYVSQLCEDQPGKNPARTRQAKPGTPPISDIREEYLSNPESLSGRAKVARGARLTLTDCPPDWLAFAQQERPDLDPRRTWDEFRDYWIAVPGQKGIKADWPATWRNWCRRQQRNNGAHHARTETAYDRRARINAEIAIAGQRAWEALSGGLNADDPL